MVLKIRLGKKRERRLKKHLEKEHPSTRGKTSLEENGFSTRKQIDKITNSIPGIKCQAIEVTELEGGKRKYGNNKRTSKKYS